MVERKAVFADLAINQNGPGIGQMLEVRFVVSGVLGQVAFKQLVILTNQFEVMVRQGIENRLILVRVGRQGHFHPVVACAFHVLADLTKRQGVTPFGGVKLDGFHGYGRRVNLYDLIESRCFPGSSERKCPLVIGFLAQVGGLRLLRTIGPGNNKLIVTVEAPESYGTRFSRL